MRDIADGLTDWLASGRRFALATVVRTWHSAPRQPGAAMAVAENGEVIGSVSGGCVEAAVYDLALESLSSGQAALQRYGISDDDALSVGLTCGGILEVLVQPVVDDVAAQISAVLDAIARQEPVAVISTIEGATRLGTSAVIRRDSVEGSFGCHPRLDAAVTERARGLLAQGATSVIHIGADVSQLDDDVAIFVQSFAPPPHMVVFGAIDFAGAVARIGKFLGYHVTVCDARPVFATPKRFPDADEVVVQWPHRYLDSITVDQRTVICVLTHDPKFDIPLLERALRTPAGYVGAMGSRRTHLDRVERLRAAGMTEAELDRLSSPIGLDLGARTPEETAVAIAAEIIAMTWGGTGQRLAGGALAIHR